MSNNFNSISTLWMYLSLSVNIHQSYRFKMNVKLIVDNLVFIRIIQLAITDIRIGISSPNIFLRSLLFLISLHFSLILMRSFGLSRSFLKKVFIEGLPLAILLLSFGREVLWIFCRFLVKDFWTTASTVSVVSAALAGFDDNFCFAKSFSFSSNFSFL